MSLEQRECDLKDLEVTRLTGISGRPTHELVLGDCVAGMRARGEAFADVVVTSPPYNLGIRYSSYDDTLPRDAYLEWTREWALACKDALSPAGSLFLNVGSKPSDPWIAMDVSMVFRELFVLQNTFHWVKSIAIEDRARQVTSHGHYKPLHSERYVNDCHEFVFHLTHRGDVPLDRTAVGVPYQDKTNVARWSGKKDVHCRGNTWFIPYETIQSRKRERPHPATFPPRLAEMCLRLHGLDRIRLAMDPFLGLGSTGLACASLGIDFLGFELDKEYLGVAAERIGNELLRLSHLMDEG